MNFDVISYYNAKNVYQAQGYSGLVFSLSSTGSRML